MNFEKYSYYYDLLYKDKNYEAEADYVKTKLLQQKLKYLNPVKPNIPKKDKISSD